MLLRGDGQLPVSVVALPASGWKRSGTASRPGYLFSSRTGTTVSISWKSGKLVVKAKGSLLRSLADAPIGRLALRIELASGSLCAWPAVAITDSTARWQASKSQPASTCPAIPPTPAAS
ncbi:hypothetical protein KGQ64_16345 [bacterium]|nr:hypothetical protein [bacterium]